MVARLGAARDARLGKLTMLRSTMNYRMNKWDASDTYDVSEHGGPRRAELLLLRLTGGISK